MNELSGIEEVMGDRPASGPAPPGKECWHGEKWLALCAAPGKPPTILPVYVYGCCNGEAILIDNRPREEKCHGGTDVGNALQGAETVARSLGFRREREVAKRKSAIVAPPGGIHT